VAVLELTAQGKNQTADGKNRILSTAIGILKNPILIGVVGGTVWSLLRIPMPPILNSVMSSVGGTATPLGLMAMGASLRPEELKGGAKAAGFATFIKLVLLCVILLPVAGALGFREQKIIAILVMLGSPATISCYIMARNMGHKGNLTSGVVILSTILGAFTMTGWIFLIKTMGWL